jgi:ferredoxin--NADP+ reductase
MQTNSTDQVPLEKVQIRLVSPKNPVLGTVVGNELCMNGKSASYVKHLTIDVSETPLAGAFRSGQSFGVIPPGRDSTGRPHKLRLYSLACPSWGEDGRGNIISTTPKRLIDEFAAQSPADDPSDHHLFLGVCSNYLCDLRAGDRVRLSGPNGKRFQLPRDRSAHQYLFLATGTGIAPFRGMLMDLLTGAGAPCPGRIHLVMGSPYTTDLLYHEFFMELADRFPNFHYHTAISREQRPDGQRGRYVHELLAERLEEIGPVLRDPRTLIYVCGLTGIRTGLFRMLAEHGLDAGYLSRSSRLEQIAPSDWSDADLKRGIQATARCMLELY